MEIAFVLEKFVFITVIFALSLVVAMYSTLAERKIAAFLQDHYIYLAAFFSSLLNNHKQKNKNNLLVHCVSRDIFYHFSFCHSKEKMTYANILSHHI
jgi:hypothetical protein